MARRVLSPLRRSSAAPVEPPAAALPDGAVATIAAVDDLIENLPDLLAARVDIQRRRRRSDSEIFALFPPRFTPDSDAPGYAAAYDAVVRAFQLRELLQGNAAANAAYGRTTRTPG